MRLDQKLVELGLAPTRARARDLVKRGFVSVEGERCDKPSREVAASVSVAVSSDAPAYVSRGGEKLEAALVHFDIDVNGLEALDIGASTGGFTQVLLTRGARRVYAVDVGKGQLHEILKSDARVVSLEEVDARSLTSDMVPVPVAIIVADLSFISLAKGLGPALALAAPGAWLVALIKPQFEVGRANVGKGGIVRNGDAVKVAVDAVETWLSGQPGWKVASAMPSPIRGGSGNAEYLIAARRDG